ncbi:MAG: hypothetical protein AB7H88_16000 [Vicinamibacterales bacterium]
MSRHAAFAALAGALALAAACGGAPTPPASTAAPAAAPDPRHPAGATLELYAPAQHDLYDGHFVITANRLYMVGGLHDAPGWDHMDNSGATVHPVEGTAAFDVDEIGNTGTFEARMRVPEGDLVVTLDRIHEFSPCQDGGVAAFLHEHGADSGCGDANWPKTLVYVAGWGYGHATLNGEPLYQDYEMHFMVTEGIRNRDTLRVDYPNPSRPPGAGGVNPAAQQLDFYIRSPESDERNTPKRAVFAHFFGMEVTWK